MVGDERSGDQRRAAPGPSADPPAGEHRPARPDRPGAEVPPVVVDRAADTMPTGEVRIGDRERDQVVGRLREAVGSGHLTLDEFTDRVDAALAAATASDLAPLTADLPRATTQPAPPAHTTDPTPDVPTVAPTPGRSRVIAVMSGSSTRGRWRVAPKVRAIGFWGSACVDLRHALFETPVVDIHATAIMGGVTVIVPEGIPVELDGCVLMGGADNRTKLDGIVAGAPVVRVHASGLWGGVDVRTKRSRDRDGEDQGRDAPGAHGVHGRHHSGHRERTRPAGDRPGGERLAEVRRALDTTEVGPDLPDGTLTIAFTDIVDSTAVVESMGDQRWSGVLAEHDRALRSIVAARGGTVVKGNGDGYLVVFPSARQAVLAALDLRDTSALTLRVGLHTGEVVRQDGDVYGRNVIAASRIAGVADPGTVAVSALTKDLIESSGDLAFSPPRTVELKGLAQPWTVHEVGHQTGPAGT